MPLHRISRHLDRLLWVVSAVFIGAGCSPEQESMSADPALAAPSELSVEDMQRSSDERPSVVLVVLDTLRADAVSAYGEVRGTTPTFDELAARGVRYAHAYAPAPWTVSSHATLFSGLRVDQHGIGLDGVSYSPDSLQMLAEDFREAGYQTAGFAENSLVSSAFGLDQGFDHFEATDIADVVRDQVGGRDGHAHFRLAHRVRDWARVRDKARPYFLFVNIMDAHDPYLVRPRNHWVPTDADADELSYVSHRYETSSALCAGVPSRRDLALLRGLYLGDVSAADEKLGLVLAALGGERAEDRLLTIVTADHGEHLGEHGLMGHRFSVRNPALRIPLAVTGLPKTPSAVIETAVELRSVRQSLHCWALGEGCPAELPRRTVPDEDGPVAQPIIGIYSDASAVLPEPVRKRLGLPGEVSHRDRSRRRCGEDDRVFGDMVSLLRYPMKMIWFDGHEPVLYDLSWDPDEKSNQLDRQSELAAAFRSEVEMFVRENLRERPDREVPELSEEAARALESLGYAE